MRKNFSASYVKRALIVACTSAGSFTFLPRVFAADQDIPAANQQAADQSNQPVRLPDGFELKDVSADSGVKSTLVGLTDRAVSKDSYNSFFSSFLAELAKRDKNRAQEFKGVDQDRLNSIISQIQSEWQIKYGQSFSISDKNLVFNDQFPIVQGDVTDSNVAATNWPASQTTGLAINAGATDNANNNANNDQDKLSELSKGTEVAIIRFPAGDGMPHLDVSLVHRTLSGWYVSVPDNMTGEQLYNGLCEHLNYVASHQDQWPSDMNDGYRMVARNVVAALYGIPAPTGTQTPQASIR